MERYENSIIWDDVDIFIIKQFYDAHFKGKELNAWKITTKYKWDGVPGSFALKSATNKFYVSKYHIIRNRLKKMESWGLVQIKEKVRERVYILKGNRVLLCKHKFFSGYKDSLQVLGKDNKWMIFQL